MAARPLDDVTVLDFSQGVAGPAAGAFLADLGADVLAIEPPGGKTARKYSGPNVIPNIARNKRSIVIDLKADESTELVQNLVEDADVLFHNNRPGVSERLGIDYETVSEINPALVYCSITGYGETGPYRDRPTIDPLAQAMSGLMSMTGEPDRKPSRIGASVADIGTALAAAFASLGALRHAERTGEGQKVEASLLDTAASVMGSWYTEFDKNGEVPTRQGHTWNAYAPSGVFETATDPIYLATPLEFLWDRVCDAVDREDWQDDPRFETSDDRLENRDALHAEMDEEFSNYERDELLERLHEGGVPASEVQTVGQAAHDPHLHERGTIQEVEDVDGEQVLATATPALFSSTPATIESGPPQTGEHTRELLAERGYDETAIEALIDTGVVDASN